MTGDNAGRINDSAVEDTNRLIELAKAATARKDFPKAVVYWQKVIDGSQIAPVDAWLHLGNALRKTFDFDAAEAVALEAAAKYPGNVKIAMELGLVAMARRDFPEAIVRWQLLINRFGTKTPARAWLALSKAHRSNLAFETAEAAAREALTNHPNNVHLALELGEIALARRDFPEAEARWQALLDRSGPAASVDLHALVNQARQRLKREKLMFEPDIKVTGDPDSNSLATAMARAFRLVSEGTMEPIDPDVLSMEGMSGRKYRLLINQLVREVPAPRYLEIGTWLGSTLFSATSGNEVVAVAIDNWSLFGGPREEFLANLERFQTPDAQIRIIESDYKAVEYAALGQFNIYFFDGPHSEQDHETAIAIALPALDQEFLLIVDDWNLERVRCGTRTAMAALGITVLYSIEIRTTLNGTQPRIRKQHSEWHNGYFLAACRYALDSRDGR